MIVHQRADLFASNADIIAHQVNCRGVMGSGVARQVKDLYPKAFQKYATACRFFMGAPSPNPLLGKTQFVETERNGKAVCIANMFAQEGFGSDGACYTNDDAFESCLRAIREYAIDHSCKTIALPWRIGCVRGGGDWDAVVLPLIQKILGDLPVELYELPGKE